MPTVTDPPTVPAPPGGPCPHAGRADAGTGALVLVPEALAEVDAAEVDVVGAGAG